MYPQSAVSLSFPVFEQLPRVTGDVVCCDRGVRMNACARVYKGNIRGLRACVNCERAATRLAEMPLIVTAALSKQQLWSEAEHYHLHPCTSLTDPQGD